MVSAPEGRPYGTIGFSSVPASTASQSEVALQPWPHSKRSSGARGAITRKAPRNESDNVPAPRHDLGECAPLSLSPVELRAPPVRFPLAGLRATVGGRKVPRDASWSPLSAASPRRASVPFHPVGSCTRHVAFPGRSDRMGVRARSQGASINRLDGFRIAHGLVVVRGPARLGLDHLLKTLLAQLRSPTQLYKDHVVTGLQARSCSFGSRIVTSWFPGTSSMTWVTPLGHRISNEAFPSSPSPKCSLGSLQE